MDSGDPLYVETRAFTHPLTILESMDRTWVLANAFEGSSVAGGNGGAGGVCVHSRPEFGDIAPGATVERRGRLWIGRAHADEVLASYLADPLEAGPRRPEREGEPPRLPCPAR